MLSRTTWVPTAMCSRMESAPSSSIAPEHSPGPAAPSKVGEGAQGGPHGFRVGVVRVVDDGDAVGPFGALHPPAAGGRLGAQGRRDACGGDAGGVRGCRRCQQVGDVVGADQPGRDVVPGALAGQEKVEFGAAAAAARGARHGPALQRDSVCCDGVCCAVSAGHRGPAGRCSRARWPGCVRPWRRRGRRPG